jgi:hypothetical protein
MGRRFEQYKMRQGTRQIVTDGIHKSEQEIARVEKDLADSEASLAEMERTPNLEPWVLQQMRAAVGASEQTLSELKQAHAEHVTKMQEPSRMYPTGITA